MSPIRYPLQGCPDAATNEEDLADGCTGEIVEDDLIIKD
ncbi:unnamed protein product [Ectocarpus sp. 6 AP-2014]